MSDLFKHDTSMDVFCCPVCGSTNLAVGVDTTAVQEPDGSWKIKEVDPEDLRFACTNVNVEVKCCNETCGNPTLADGTEIDVSNQSIFDYWKTLKNIPASQEPTKEEMEEFENFLGEIFYHPWQGVIGDCVKIS